jgi:hypothetical protein
VSRRTAIVDFEPDSQWYGVEVEVYTSIPFKTLLWFQSAAISEDQKQLIETYKVFARDFLISWNIEDEDNEPYPASVDGIMSVDSDLVNTIVLGWIEAVTNPPQKSSDGLKDGGLSGEERMEALANTSTSLGN